MTICAITVQNLRNFIDQGFEPGAACNIFWGDNGSGKSSLLEAIHLLATGRSFRTRQVNHVIQHQKPHCAVMADVLNSQHAPEPVRLALQKGRDGSRLLKLAGQAVQSVSDIATWLPVQVLHLGHYQLLQDSPESRRKLLDWGVFHVKHAFLSEWRRFNQLLKQRNAALRMQTQPQAVWDVQLAQAGEAIDTLRQACCDVWLPQAISLINAMLDLPAVSIDYKRGWDSELSLEAVLASQLQRDLALGYTHAGPQRADLRVKVAGKPAQQVLSTGQQKRLVTALQLSQSIWVQHETQQRGLLLIDDLPSELDTTAQTQLAQLLSGLDMQVFLTCVAQETAEVLAATLNPKMFHVKHGEVEKMV